MTYLKLRFISEENEKAFLKATGESDVNQVHIGLINFAVKFAGMASCEVVGDPIEFHVKQADGTWTTETVEDPVARIEAGEVMEPYATPIKMLEDTTLDLWAENRIANRYQPFVANPYFAEITPQREVEVIIVDSGINHTHAEFVDAKVTDLFMTPSFTDCTDDLGHGTAIAALVAGKTLGVNPHASLKVVKISGKDQKPTLGELGDIFDQLLDYHTNSLDVPKVVNLSWATPRSAYLDDKITALIEAGITVVAAAGNSELNIDDVTPAGISGVFTVAASTKDDRALYAVYGVNKKLDMFAPGEAVTVPVPTDDASYAATTGSSFSAAFVSGVASVLYGLRSTAPIASDVAKAIKDDATMNALILDSRVTQAENRLLHRADTNSMPEDNVQYLGVATLGEPDGMFVDIRMLMPASTLAQANGEDAVFTLSYGSDEIEAIMAASTVDGNGKVSIRIDPATTMPDGVKVKQMFFNVTLTCPGIKFVSPPIYFFLVTPDSTNADVRPLLDELSASSSFTFLEEVDQESVVYKGIKS